MGRRVVNFCLFLVLVGTLGVHALVRRDPTRRNVEFMPDMAYSPAYDSLAPNPNFSDGKTLQLPEPGTIARGRMPLHYGPSFEDFLRAGDELQNPFKSDDAAARERGAFVYANYCRMCHGPGGKGDGPMSQHGIPPPASFLAKKPVPLRDGEMFHILTYGQKNMPSVAALLTRDDRWKAILHVRALQQEAAGEKQP